MHSYPLPSAMTRAYARPVVSGGYLLTMPVRPRVMVAVAFVAATAATACSGSGHRTTPVAVRQPVVDSTTTTSSTTEPPSTSTSLAKKAAATTTTAKRVTTTTTAK